LHGLHYFFIVLCCFFIMQIYFWKMWVHIIFYVFCI
jgi:hypothetical protein